MADAKAAMNRPLAYFAAVGCFVALVAAGTAIGSVPDPRILYLCALFAICASPILFIDRLNGRYMMLSTLMPIYFANFGASDLLDLFVGDASFPTIDGEGQAELVILIGALLIVAAYRAIAEIPVRAAHEAPARDWPPASVAIIGGVFWLAGAAATWVWQIDVIKSAWGGLHGLSPAMGMALTVGFIVLHPLGIALLAYGFVKSRNRLFGLLIVAVVAGEFVLGFMEDSKEIAIKPAIIVLVAKFLVDGRIPKSWLIAAAVAAVLSFPVFQAYRLEVLSERGISRADAAMDLAKNIEIALHSNKSASQGAEYTSRSFLSRISYKPIIQMIVDRTGVTAPFQDGHTIGLIFASFVPRIFWADKPDMSVGQLFNRELRITDTRDNYISTTILGEMYWNFGWLGIVFGSASLGAFLGAINRYCDLSRRISVSRFLILSVTTYGFCVRFEDGIAMTGTIWWRTLFAVWIFEILFARRVPADGAMRAGKDRAGAKTPNAAGGLRPLFRNLLR
jgi:hypothetical protein